MNEIINKMFSGRYGALIFVIGTYCLSILMCFFLVYKSKLDAKEFIVLIAGLGTLGGMMWKDYIHNNVDADETDKQVAREEKKNGNGHTTEVGK